MVWASIEMAILTLIFVVCLKKRQPSLPPSLVAKVLEDLLQTQNSSHSRRRNSDSEILQLTPNHREVVRQRSADDLGETTADILKILSNDILDYCIFIYKLFCMCVCVCVYVYFSACIYIYICILVCVYIHLCVCVCLYIALENVEYLFIAITSRSTLTRSIYIYIYMYKED